MSTDINLLLEYRSDDGWQPALHAANRVKEPRTHLGILNVCWWSVRSRPTSLFFGDNAVIPFTPGLPEDLSQRVRDYVWPNFHDNMTYAAWIPLPDLDLASWHHRHVIVGGPVLARHASLFGLGNQPPPLAGLKTLGVEEPVLERVTDWKNQRKYQYCQPDFDDVRNRHPDSRVDVTWIESLEEFVGWVWHQGLAGLVGLESPERYRIVTSVG